MELYETVPGNPSFWHHCACWNLGRSCIASRKHADINTPKSPVTLLIRAAEKGDLQTVQDLLSTKTWLGNPMLNVNSIDCDRNRYPETGCMTALIAAAQARHRRNHTRTLALWSRSNTQTGTTVEPPTTTISASGGN